MNREKREEEPKRKGKRMEVWHSLSRLYICFIQMYLKKGVHVSFNSDSRVLMFGIGSAYIMAFSNTSQRVLNI